MTTFADPAAPVRLTRAETKIAVVLALGGLLAVLDTTIVVVAMPQFMRAFDVGVATAQWIVIAYTLGTVAAMVVAAPLARRWGARKVYLAALVIFSGATIWSAAAPGLGMLIVARAVQGSAAGLVQPVGMALAFGLVAPERRALMTTITGLALFVGPVLGPVLGGLALHAGSWRLLFWITVPPALLAAFGTLRWIPQEQARRSLARADVAGAALLVAGVVTVTLGLSADGLGTPSRIGAVVVGVLLGAAFARRSAGRADAVLQVGLLRDRTFGRGAAVLGLYAMPYFGTMLLMPTYVQVVRGESALVSAALMVPGAVGMGISVQIAGRLLERLGSRAVVGSGLGLAIVQQIVMVSALRADTSYVLLGALTFLQGLGTGAIMMPTMVAATRRLVGQELMSGSSMLPIVSTVSMAIGTALFGALYAWLAAGSLDAVSALRVVFAATLLSMVIALVIRLRTPSDAQKALS